MLKIDPNVVLDYSANVLPKKIKKLPLNELDKAVEKAVECANKDNKEGLSYNLISLANMLGGEEEKVNEE